MVGLAGADSAHVMLSTCHDIKHKRGQRGVGDRCIDSLINFKQTQLLFGVQLGADEEGINLPGLWRMWHLQVAATASSLLSLSIASCFLALH